MVMMPRSLLKVSLFSINQVLNKLFGTLYLKRIDITDESIRPAVRRLLLPEYISNDILQHLID